MTRPTRDAIDTFMSITGVSESEALQKLEEHGGNLHEAVNAYFSPGERNITNPAADIYPHHRIPDMDNRMQAGPNRLSQFLSAVRSFKPSSLLDPIYRRSLLNELSPSAFPSHPPFVSHLGETMGVPVGFSGRNEQPQHPTLLPSDYNGIRTSSSHGLESQGNVLRDDGSHFYADDIEEEMIQAAVEASKREGSSSGGLIRSQLKGLEDDEFSRALSLSLKTAEQEIAMRAQGVKEPVQQLGAEKTKNNTRKKTIFDSQPANSPVQEVAEDMHARSTFSCTSNDELDVHPKLSKDAIPSNEWGGLSSKELDEAVMLEATLFGEIAEGSSHHSKYEPLLQSGLEKYADSNSSLGTHSSSSSVMEKQSLQEQQSAAYLPSLHADREKEINSLKEAEFCLNGDESRNKLLDEENIERWVAAKEASLPEEPATDHENAVNLLIRMPDGSRRGRRFLKSDKLQILFDFIDIGRAVKPGTYRVVRPYPRQAFSPSDGSLSLNEVGLNSKQEVLFLEFI